MSTHSSPGRFEDGLVASLGDVIDNLPSALWTEGDVHSKVWDEALLDPARDILSRSGKGFRARLLEHSWRLAGGDPRSIPDLLPLTIELLHVGSLIIDDIEDDSSERRGHPSLHRVYGLPLALNTGNWLYFLAMALISRLPLEPSIRLDLFEEVSLGLMRCHQGQALDLATTVTSLPRKEVARTVATVTRLKTGALMGLAASLGARAAGAATETVRRVGSMGCELGVGLQMLDDWSGIRIDARKSKGMEDLRLARPTWPWAWLAMSGDQVMYAEMAHKARDASIDWEWEQLRTRLKGALRQTAPKRIGDQLRDVASDLEVDFGTSTAVEAIRSEIEVLGRAYG